MQRWLKDGGWIVVLTVFIFLAYCTFYLGYRQVHKPIKPYVPAPYRGIMLESIGLFTFPAYASDEEDAQASETSPPEIGESPDELPSVDSSGEIPEISDIEQENSAAESEPETPNDESEEENEEEEQVVRSGEFGGDSLVGDEVSLLIEIRDTLGIILMIMLLGIAAALVYIILFPLRQIFK